MDLEREAATIIELVTAWRVRVEEEFPPLGFNGVDDPPRPSPPYSTRKLMKAVFPDVLVTGRQLPRDVIEAVQVRGRERTICYRRRMSIDLRRVAIAHAAAHLALDEHMPGPCAAHWLTGAYAPTDFRERRADLVAAEYLAPLIELDEVLPWDLAPPETVDKQFLDDEIDDAAAHFHVPPRFIHWRLDALLELRYSRYRRLGRL